jgi:hypothetical protein
MIDNIYMTKLLYDGNFPCKEQWRLQDRPPLQTRAITYNDEAAPWSRSNYLMGTRLLPSSDDSDNISGTPLGILGLR